MTKLSVPDMSCGHCKASITQAIEAAGAKVEVDLPSRTITVEGLDTAAAIKTLEEIGFPATAA